MTSTRAVLPPRVSRPWVLCASVAWLVAATLAPRPEPLAVSPGRFEGEVTLIDDVIPGRFGPWALGEIGDGIVLVDLEDAAEIGRGDVLEVTGSLHPEPGTASGRVYGGVLTVRSVLSVRASRFPPHLAGRFVRSTVETRLQPFDDGRALLAGFLIGETSRIAESDVEAMRRAGLAHFVAVSGSNVALFLGLLAVVAGPLALGPRRRAVLGLAALPVYAAATRFEPSVMRASLMAGIVLGGRLVGIVLEAWQLLSLAVFVLVVVDPGLTGNVGFQLSVAATAGVLIGARWPVSGRIGRALAVTLGAQIAVAPLLLLHFGLVPALSPLTNLVAAPIVVTSTVLGALGAAGVGFLIAPAGWLAEVVLALARGAATWPQLGLWQMLGATAAALALLRFPRARVPAALAGSAFLVVALATASEHPPPGSVVVLDVGQGDAILIHGGEGRFALVDGGPDPAVVIDKLRAYGVRSLELAVLTHVHADHATGLIGVLDTYRVGRLWASTEPHSTPASRDLMRALEEWRVPVSAPEPGTRWRIGSLELVVEGPLRRYASPNDQSIVLTVSGPGRTMLLSGDIETHAQADLSHLRADVLKVPHQGAATSDEEWLRLVDADLAVVSVGPNDFGHPAEWVIDLLEETGQVSRTDADGDVVVDLGRTGR